MINKKELELIKIIDTQDKYIAALEDTIRKQKDIIEGAIKLIKEGEDIRAEINAEWQTPMQKQAREDREMLE